MSMFGPPFPNGQTVTIWTPGASVSVDRYNNAVDGAETSTVVEGCAIDFGPGDEDHSRGRDATIATRTVYAPAGTVVDARCTVEIDGLRWDIAEPPAAWQSPFTGAEPGVVIRLRRVEA